LWFGVSNQSLFVMGHLGARSARSFSESRLTAERSLFNLLLRRHFISFLAFLNVPIAELTQRMLARLASSGAQMLIFSRRGFSARRHPLLFLSLLLLA